MKNEVTSITCPVCDSNRVHEYGHYRVSTVITDVESGELICSQCGMVINDRLEDRYKARFTHIWQ